MSFGKRDRDGWKAAQDDVEGIQEMLMDEENTSVRTILEQIRRSKLLTESLAPVQQDLWHRLYEAYKLGGVDLIRINFQLSGMEMEDLLDLLYVANELAVYSEGGEYEEFGEALFAFLKTNSCFRMDALLSEYFGKYPSKIEPRLIRLVKSEEMVRSRLDDLLEMETDYLTQAVMGKGVIRLLEMEEEDGCDERNRPIYIDEEDALRYLQRLMQDETILDNSFIELIKKVRNSPIMFVLIDKIIQWLENPTNRNNYIGGFGSIGAAVVRKLSAAGLIFTINSQAESLVDERLLALLRMKSLSQISDAALMELLMEKDETSEKGDSRFEERSNLRKSIRGRKEFRPRLMKLGIIGIFQRMSFPA